MLTICGTLFLILAMPRKNSSAQAMTGAVKLLHSCNVNGTCGHKRQKSPSYRLEAVADRQADLSLWVQELAPANSMQASGQQQSWLHPQQQQAQQPAPASQRQPPSVDAEQTPASEPSGTGHLTYPHRHLEMDIFGDFANGPDCVCAPAVGRLCTRIRDPSHAPPCQ